MNNTFTNLSDKIIITPIIDDSHYEIMDEVIVDFRSMIKRDWFINHAYFCLPLTIANQYGFGIKSLSTFDVTWNGGDRPEDVDIKFIDKSNSTFQIISAHFGMGTFSMQNHMVWKTPENINLITMNPPNMFIDGITNMNGVVEADNLKRDFTFTLRITRPNHTIRINRGDIISAILPVQRYVADKFKLVRGDEEFGQDYVNHIKDQSQKFAYERSNEDIHKQHRNGRRYFDGIDADGCPFHDHQPKIKKPT